MRIEDSANGYKKVEEDQTGKKYNRTNETPVVRMPKRTKEQWTNDQKLQEEYLNAKK